MDNTTIEAIAHHIFDIAKKRFVPYVTYLSDESYSGEQLKSVTVYDGNKNLGLALLTVLIGETTTSIHKELLTTDGTIVRLRHEDPHYFEQLDKYLTLFDSISPLS